jgi:hypothetical protein
MTSPIALSLFSQLFFQFSTGPQANTLQTTAGWRPPQWSQQSGTADKGGPTLTILVNRFVTGNVSNLAPGQTITASGAPIIAPPSWIVPPAPGFTQTQTIYVFDGVLRSEHRRELVVTSHPVQTGANISDHAYLKPARLKIEVKMSDAMQSYVAGQYAGTPSRSVSAYQTLLELQKNREALSIATRLQQYDNMLITDIRSEENPSTRFGLTAEVEFTEIIPAPQATAVSSAITYNGLVGSRISARSQTTNKTVAGETQVQQVPQAITQQHSISSALQRGASVPGRKVPGAGYWSSNIIPG